MTDHPDTTAGNLRSRATGHEATSPDDSTGTPGTDIDAIEDSGTVPEPTASEKEPDANGRTDPDGPVSGDAEDTRASTEEFAREHDPAHHDVAAGEELRQRGDWTADEAGGPQVWDAEGHLVEGTSPAEPTASSEHSHEGDAGSHASDVTRRTSSLDEVRDGGFSVGSAALIDDGAMPLGHPVKAWRDTQTFATPDQSTYSDAEPDLWFTDAGAAERAGFRPAD